MVVPLRHFPKKISNHGPVWQYSVPADIRSSHSCATLKSCDTNINADLEAPLNTLTMATDIRVCAVEIMY